MENTVLKGDKKVIRGWIIYDWANSVYQLTISSAIFPIYYIAVTRNHEITFFGVKVINTVIYSWAITCAYLFLAIFSPMFSSIADYTGRRKSFMKFFTWLGALACGSLFFFDGKNIELGIICFSLGTLGYGGSLVFYNSFLPVIAAPKDHDRISAQGYSMGYLGGVVLLLFNLLVVLKPGWFGIHDDKLPSQLAFLTVFVWWIAFAQITFRRLPKYTFRQRKEGQSVIFGGYTELRKVFFQVRKSFILRNFLAGYLFIMMGLLTVMFMAATYGEKELHVPDWMLILVVLTIQLVGMGGAYLFAWLSGKIGNFRALLISVSAWVLICIFAYFITNRFQFCLAAFFIGVVMGGTQALARSTYSKHLPETQDHTSFFSFFDVMEKLATVAGTFLFGLLEVLTGSMRYSVLAISFFFIIGLGFLLMIQSKARHLV